MMPIGPTPLVKKPSTSLMVRPASASAPRALSAWIWNGVMWARKRVGCSHAPTTAVLPQIAHREASGEDPSRAG
jgi:hypothetical protein